MGEAFAVEVYKSRDEWLAARRSGIGASDAAAILGANPWRAPLAVWAEKTGRLKADDRTRAKEWGLRLEALIRDAYLEEKARAPLLDSKMPFGSGPDRWVLYRSLEHPFLHATPDCFLAPVLERDGQGPGALEIKNVGERMADDWRDGAPIYYRVQLQQQMFVCALGWGALAALVGGQRLVSHDEAANPEFYAAMLERLAAFWWCVEHDAAPAPDGSESSKETLAAIYPKETPGLVVDLPGEAIAWDEEESEAARQMALWKDRHEAARARIKGAIGKAEAGRLPGGYVWRWKEVERAGYEVKEARYRELRRVKDNGMKFLPGGSIE